MTEIEVGDIVEDLSGDFCVVEEIIEPCHEDDDYEIEGLWYATLLDAQHRINNLANFGRAREEFQNLKAVHKSMKWEEYL